MNWKFEGGLLLSCQEGTIYDPADNIALEKSENDVYEHDRYRVNAVKDSLVDNSYLVFYRNPESNKMPEHDVVFLLDENGTCQAQRCYVNNTSYVAYKVAQTFEPGDRLTLNATGYYKGEKTGEASVILADYSAQKDSIVSTWTLFDLTKLRMVDAIDFEVYANLVPPIAFKAAPKLYYGDNINETFSVAMEGIPNMPFGTTGFMDWIIKTGTKLAIQGFEMYTGVGVATEKGQALIDKGSKMLTPKLKKISKKGQRLIEKGEKMIESEMPNTFIDVTETLANIGSTAPSPNISSSSSGNIEFSTGEKDFFFFQVYPKEEYSEMIDNYFHLYGYAVKKIKVPNIHVRKGWTYTKTANAIVVGGAPASALQNIANIFNKGIRFWNDGDNIGDYSSKNRPLTEPEEG